jgi:N-acetyl-anhydromuramyl-L-alanine amidase AmpD
MVGLDREMRSNANDFTIGVELANCGLVVEHGGHYWHEAGRRLVRYHGPSPVAATLSFDNGKEVHGFWEPYPKEQIDALEELLDHIRRNGYQDVMENIVGHEEIAMPFGRKTDPGPVFWWSRFHRMTRRRTRHGS